jgi:hypothetical protein
MGGTCLQLQHLLPATRCAPPPPPPAVSRASAGRPVRLCATRPASSLKDCQGHGGHAGHAGNIRGLRPAVLGSWFWATYVRSSTCRLLHKLRLRADTDTDTKKTRVHLS